MLIARSDDRRPWRGVLAGSFLALVLSLNGHCSLAQNGQDWVGKQVITKAARHPASRQAGRRQRESRECARGIDEYQSGLPRRASQRQLALASRRE